LKRLQVVDINEGLMSLQCFARKYDSGIKIYQLISLKLNSISINCWTEGIAMTAGEDTQSLLGDETKALYHELSNSPPKAKKLSKRQIIIFSVLIVLGLLLLFFFTLFPVWIVSVVMGFVGFISSSIGIFKLLPAMLLKVQLDKEDKYISRKRKCFLFWGECVAFILFGLVFCLPGEFLLHYVASCKSIPSIRTHFINTSHNTQIKKKSSIEC
jgi:hypothetical protein